MAEDRKEGPETIVPANDKNGSQDEPGAETWIRIDRAALTLARIIGRRMAREDFERLHAANDNRLIASETTEDGADTD
ncbi:hypothetical protein [Brucella intermedia]|uniref:hypothetical protein n=1 Tax=Brucella intermedia TaxID=94625 RepID=UPI002248ABD2|nr:hypothetical protein [Brucella intermedia]